MREGRGRIDGIRLVACLLLNMAIYYILVRELWYVKALWEKETDRNAI